METSSTESSPTVKPMYPDAPYPSTKELLDTQDTAVLTLDTMSIYEGSPLSIRFLLDNNILSQNPLSKRYGFNW